MDITDLQNIGDLPKTDKKIKIAGNKDWETRKFFEENSLMTSKESEKILLQKSTMYQFTQ